MYPYRLARTFGLLFSILVAFVLSSWVGALYQAEILALVFITYVLVRKFRRHTHKAEALGAKHTLDATILTLIILTVVLTTGALGSPYFFLMYFLMFGIALLVDPVSSAIATATMIALFLPGLNENFEMIHIVSLLSLPLMVPFALFLGSSFTARERLKAELARSQAETSTVETDALLFISTVMRTHVNSLIELSQDYSPNQRMAEVRGTARRLQKLIDKFVSAYE